MLVFCRTKTFMDPWVVFNFVAAVAGAKPVCIQWRRVFVAGGVFVGISRSTMITAYAVPFRRCVVAIVGMVWVARASC